MSTPFHAKLLALVLTKRAEFGTPAVFEQQPGRDHHCASLAVAQRTLKFSRGAGDRRYIIEAIQRLGDRTDHI